MFWQIKPGTWPEKRSQKITAQKTKKFALLFLGIWFVVPESPRWLLAKGKVEEAVKETLEWLDDNQEAEKEEFEAKQKELEQIANPIIQKVYQAGAGGAGGAPEDDEDLDDEDSDEL